MAWWSLTCRMAQDWKRAHDRAVAARLSAGGGVPAGSTAADGGALDLGARAEPGADAAVDVPACAAASLPLAEPALLNVSEDSGRAAARSAAAATGLVYTKNKEDAQSETRIAGRFEGNDVGPEWGHNGAAWGNGVAYVGSEETEPASAGRPTRGPDRACAVRAVERERAHGAGVGAPGSLLASEGAAAAGLGPDCDRYAGGVYPAIGETGSEGRSESALPVRQRPEIQALPRQGLKVPSPASLATEPGTAVASDHNRGQGPQGAIL